VKQIAGIYIFSRGRGGQFAIELVFVQKNVFGAEPVTYFEEGRKMFVLNAESTTLKYRTIICRSMDHGRYHGL
jgi:hypothetical protein